MRTPKRMRHEATTYKGANRFSARRSPVALGQPSLDRWTVGRRLDRACHSFRNSKWLESELQCRHSGQPMVPLQRLLAQPVRPKIKSIN